ncbi:hypothetical protein AGRA3207_005457 [Actinomadura graeca]|uniref:Uncharacterized protein n=1 Tax=Actinomadura graeca TaxID=2750812 RepID=A0ABX8QZK3_9ACTN|nr:hypothetical protein [Actinomadura graeca]QXJ24185.1 hypothetical protein AGRA3207_005457 [Actinomadura graeca]
MADAAAERGGGQVPAGGQGHQGAVGVPGPPLGQRPRQALRDDLGVGRVVPEAQQAVGVGVLAGPSGVELAAGQPGGDRRGATQGARADGAGRRGVVVDALPGLAARADQRDVAGELSGDRAPFRGAGGADGAGQAVGVAGVDEARDLGPGRAGSVGVRDGLGRLGGCVHGWARHAGHARGRL